MLDFYAVERVATSVEKDADYIATWLSTGMRPAATIYYFDPSGNRNEVFAGGYEAYPDRPTVVWTPDQLGKGIFYIDRELNERFTTVLT